MRTFTELNEREILALAISSEEEDGRIYMDFAESLRDEFPDSARVFDDMAAEESEQKAEGCGLDIVAITDHNNVRSQTDPGFGFGGVNASVIFRRMG